jgi:hypothetical protein
LKKQIITAGYILNIMPPSIGAAVGTGVHAAAAYQAKEKMAGRDSSDGHELGIETYLKETTDGVIFDTTTTSNNDAFRQIQTLSASVKYEIIPNVSPVSVEPEGMSAAWEGIELCGRWDLEEPDGIDDYKSGKLRPAHAQLGGYSLLRKSHGKPRPERLTVFHLPRVSIKKTYPGSAKYNYSVDVCERAAFTTLQHIIRDIKNFQASQEPAAFQANPMSMLCSPKHCSAFGTDFCEITKGTKSEKE